MNAPPVGHPTPDTALSDGTLAGVIEATVILALAGERMESLRATVDRDADALRARWAKNSAEYFRRRDLERAGR